jgi:hypothetical protein
MKKKQINHKLSLNKQTLSQLDAQAMSAAKGGISMPDKTYTCTANTYCNCA